MELVLLLERKGILTSFLLIAITIIIMLAIVMFQALLETNSVTPTETETPTSISTTTLLLSTSSATNTLSPTATNTNIPTIMPMNVVAPEPINVTIHRFETSAIQVTIQDLIYGQALVPVSWHVTNRPINSNLVFEQVFSEGGSTNIELPRDNSWVNSSGEGVVRPGFPSDSDTHIIVQLRVVNTQNDRTLASQQLRIPIVEGTPIRVPTEPNPTPATGQIYEDCFAEPFPSVMNLTIGEDVTYNFPPFETASPIPNYIYRTATGTDRITSLVGIDPVITLLDVTCFRQSSTDLPMRRWLIRNQDGIVGWMDEYFQFSNSEYWYLLRDSYSVDVTVNQFSLSETVVNQDETVTIEWNVENTDHVSIQMNASMPLTANGDNLPPSGSVEITVPRTSIVVFEMIYPPNLVEPLRLEVNCTHALIDPEQTANTACPDAPQDVTATVQYFENGYMMQFPSGVIVSGNSAGFFQYRLTGSNATFLHDVPDGLLPPANRFSEFWEDELMQVEIGWATGDEATLTTTTQKYRDLTETYETMLFVTPDGDVEFFGYNIE